MFRFSVSSLVKFLIGVLLVQGATVLLVVTALKTDLDQTGLLFLLLNLTVGVLTALWFTSIADGARKQALARAKESFSREREKIRVRAEQQKTKEVRNTQRQIERQKRRGQTGSNLKTGVVIGGAVGVGVVMLLTQFVTLGLLTLSTAGGAALGYGARVRQEKLGLGKKRLLSVGKPVKVIEAQAAPSDGEGAR
ncbi:MAG: hypothetical protein U9Q81_25650 [Pseudomonadota bacterium]|nr:hypothetical protein [Pseudomonadota bacterium]